ncbi:ABC transporter substrate-binding protein [Pseudooceanicola spongiae]|uniref:PhnD/SsuA/transferrin family substrate-binding protein n=1 Tax=Pseudooceanicola spongiae TaxID=2613965 RepID=A0A7L9WN76_9RHOB|nr:ABC transporter substrate-binding protein [Pseudooceanicola spongiae]QOL81274.1 PhnD/SsuA/transferrin family substrate-binding protein [Pseudooceanicola spongiae]
MKKLCATALLATTLATPSFALDKITYQLDWLPGGDKAPIYVCVEEGFCEEAGLEVSIAPGRGSSEAITKIATGVAQVGSAGIEALMAAKVTEGVPVTAIASIFNTGPHAFYTTADKGITTLADVKGKSVATSPFTSSNVFLPLVLKQNGMSEEDITLTKADPGALGPLLMTGQSDVIIAWLTDVTRYTNQAKEAGKDIVVLPWDAAGLKLYSASLIASDAFLKDQPDVAKRFVGAFLKSIQFAHDNPQKAAEDTAAMVPELSAEDVIGSWTDASKLAFNPVTDEFGLGAFDAARLASTWKLVAEAQGLDVEALDPETVVDRSFLPDAK